MTLRTVFFLAVGFFAPCCWGLPTTTPVDTSDRILHGRNVTEHDNYPYIVSIQEKISDTETAKFCGGAILNRQWILTAAHCGDDFRSKWFPNTIGVVAGTLNAYERNANRQWRVVKKFITHEGYDKNSEIENDIALILLKDPLDFNDKVQAIPLPNVDYTAKGKGLILEWGKIDNDEDVSSDILRVAKVPVNNFDECRSYFSFKLHSDSQLCLGLHFPTKACSGDSGGPFVQKVKNIDTLIGVTSFGQAGCWEFNPNIYTKVSAFLDFIQQTMDTYDQGNPTGNKVFVSSDMKQ